MARAAREGPLRPKMLRQLFLLRSAVSRSRRRAIGRRTAGQTTTPGMQSEAGAAARPGAERGRQAGATLRPGTMQTRGLGRGSGSTAATGRWRPGGELGCEWRSEAKTRRRAPKRPAPGVKLFGWAGGDFAASMSLPDGWAALASTEHYRRRGDEKEASQASREGRQTRTSL